MAAIALEGDLGIGGIVSVTVYLYRVRGATSPDDDFEHVVVSSAIVSHAIEAHAAAVGGLEAATFVKELVVGLVGFSDGVVGVEQLSKAGLIDLNKSKKSKVKILGDGELTKKLQVTAHKFSKTAEQKIIASGGSVSVANDV